MHHGLATGFELRVKETLVNASHQPISGRFGGSLGWPSFRLAFFDVVLQHALVLIEHLDLLNSVLNFV